MSGRGVSEEDAMELPLKEGLEPLGVHPYIGVAHICWFHAMSWVKFLEFVGVRPFRAWKTNDELIAGRWNRIKINPGCKVLGSSGTVFLKGFDCFFGSRQQKRMCWFHGWFCYGRSRYWRFEDNTALGDSKKYWLYLEVCEQNMFGTHGIEKIIPSGSEESDSDLTLKNFMNFWKIPCLNEWNHVFMTYNQLR